MLAHAAVARSQGALEELAQSVQKGFLSSLPVAPGFAQPSTMQR